MSKVLKVGGVLLLIGLGAFFYMRKSQGMEMPAGIEGEQAEQMARKMMEACNAEAWAQTRYVTWSFVERNSYVWDRSEGIVEYRSGDDKVILNTATQKGQAYHSGELLSGDNSDDALDKAWSSFCNDSFWLVAPLKVMDPGTKREVVETEEGKGLMVHYGAGGVTPGDSYLWYISEDGLPYAYRMWTQILPVPGMKATWEEWQTVHTGAKIATKHALGPMEVLITELNTGSTLSEIGLSENYFE